MPTCPASAGSAARRTGCRAGKAPGWSTARCAERAPRSQRQTPVWERCLSIPGLHGKVPRYLDITIRYQDLQGKTMEHNAHSSWAALLQHECDHLDGIVYPMRMTDLSLLAYNEEPGPLAREVAADPKGIDPLFIDLVERWPGRSRWFGA